MYMNIKHYHPAITISGKGRVDDLKTILPLFGKSLIVHGRSFTEKKQYRLLEYDLGRDIACYQYNGKEPTINDVKALLSILKQGDYKCVAAIGGGSVIDVAKAAAGLVNAESEPEYYMNGSLEKPGIPFIAIPTTAGSGAEATINAVIINEKTKKKLSIRDDSLLARYVILDHELIEGCPRDVIANSGMDAISQAIESYFSKSSNWLTEQYALKGFELMVKNLENAYLNLDKFDNHQITFRNIMTGSHLIGVALTNSRLGVIHGLAHPLGAIYGIPHGQVCALSIIPALEINKQHAPEKYNKLSEICGADLIRQIDYLIRHLNISNPFKGLQILNHHDIIDSTLQSGSTAANPKPIITTDIDYMLGRLFN